MFLVDTYYPLQDGVQMVTQYLAEGLAVTNDVLVVTSLRDGMQRSMDYNGVKIERIRAKRNPYTLHMVGEKALLEKKIFEYNPDVLIVVCISIWTFDWLKGRLKKYPGIKILYTHGCSIKEEHHVWNLIKEFRLRRQIIADLMEIYIEWFWYRYSKSLDKYIAEYDKVIYLYENDKVCLRMNSYGVKTGMLLGNAVDNVFFERKAFLSREQKNLTFINVSSYNENKNQELALEAFYEAEIPGSKLLLIGSQDTPYYRCLLDLNEKLKRKNEGVQNIVEIYCGISREKVMELYKEVDVYVLTSKIEAMPLSLCEASAAGLAILSTNVGHAACVPGVFLCETKEDFVTNMKLLYQEPNLRAERGKMAYDYAKLHYKISDKVKQLEQSLVQLVNGDN